MKKLEQSCHQAARDYEESSKSRAEEMEALKKASGGSNIEVYLMIKLINLAVAKGEKRRERGVDETTKMCVL